jgi:hypothetical protein
MSIPEVFPRTPTTAAGRALLAYSKGLPSLFITPTWLEGILAIEAEARAPLDVERLARALQTPNVSAWVRLLTGNVWKDGERLAPGFAGDMAAGIAAEYAALEEPTPVLLRLQHAEPLYTEDDPDWSAMVSPISEKDGGHDDR